MNDDALRVMREVFSARSGSVGCIVIANEISEARLAAAAESGLVALLQRASSGPEEIRAAIGLTRSVWPALPGAVLPFLLEQFRKDRSSARRTSPLSEREAKVLLLYADGLTTTDVGRRLELAVRTVDAIVLEVIRRLNLRNRTQAVAHALWEEMGDSHSAAERPETT
jgi:DNA-binding NarL/FixJ family response regulator